jgi:hypothetical protein
LLLLIKLFRSRREIVHPNKISLILFHLESYMRGWWHFLIKDRETLRMQRDNVLSHTEDGAPGTKKQPDEKTNSSSHIHTT